MHCEQHLKTYLSLIVLWHSGFTSSGVYGATDKKEILGKAQVWNQQIRCRSTPLMGRSYYCRNTCMKGDSPTLNRYCPGNSMCCFRMSKQTSLTRTGSMGQMSCSSMSQPNRFYYCAAKCHHGDEVYMAGPVSCGMSSDQCCTKTTGVSCTSLMQSNRQFYCASACAHGDKEYEGPIKATCALFQNKCCVRKAILPQYCTKLQVPEREFYCAAKCFHGDRIYNLTGSASCGTSHDRCCSRKATPWCTSLMEHSLNFYCAKECNKGDSKYKEGIGARCALHNTICCAHNSTTTDLCTNNVQPNTVFYCFDSCIAGDPQYTGPGGTKCANTAHRCCKRVISESTTAATTTAASFGGVATCMAIQDGQLRYCATSCVGTDVRDVRRPQATCIPGGTICCIRVSQCTALVPVLNARLYYCARQCRPGHAAFSPLAFPQPTCEDPSHTCCSMP